MWRESLGFVDGVSANRLEGLQGSSEWTLIGKSGLLRVGAGGPRERCYESSDA